MSYHFPENFDLPQPLQGGEWCSNVDQNTNLKAPLWEDLERSNEGIQKTKMVYYFFPITYMVVNYSLSTVHFSLFILHCSLFSACFTNEVITAFRSCRN